MPLGFPAAEAVACGAERKNQLGAAGGTRGPGWRARTRYRRPDPRSPPLGLDSSKELGVGLWLGSLIPRARWPVAFKAGRSLPDRFP
jgi:hypothetical protein